MMNLTFNRLSPAAVLRIGQEERKGRTRKNNYNYELMENVQKRYDGNLDHHGSCGEKRLNST